MQNCEVFNAQDVPVDISKFKTLCLNVLRAEKRKGSVNIVFVDEKTISEYNKYRGVDGPTDVLSFESDLDGFLGEVYISPAYVRKNAEYFGVSFEEEMVRVCVHGILHLLGYDHEKDESKAKEMFKIQENYVTIFHDSFDTNS